MSLDVPNRDQFRTTMTYVTQPTSFDKHIIVCNISTIPDHSPIDVEKLGIELDSHGTIVLKDYERGEVNFHTGRRVHERECGLNEPAPCASLGR